MGQFKGRSILVTGAGGFIGSHLTESLLAEGARVRAFCSYDSQGSWGWLEQIPETARGSLEVQLGDIRDAMVVEAACRDVEVVFHLAALIAIPYSYSAPRSYVETNIIGTLNVLEAARARGVARVVHTSTSEVYGTPGSLPIRETHPLDAYSPYAATKVGADQLALAYYRSFGVPVTILRPFNTYGPRQSSRAVLSTILLQLQSGRREIELGRVDTRRDFTFVADTVEGFLRAGLTPGVEGQVIQLGTGQSVSIADAFRLCCKVTGVEAVPRASTRRMRPDAGEVLVLQADPSRARERLGWEAAVTFEDGLRRTAAWLAEHKRAYKASFFYE